MQSYYKKTKSKQKSQRFYPLYPKIIIYEYCFCTKDIECAKATNVMKNGTTRLTPNKDKSF